MRSVVRTDATGRARGAVSHLLLVFLEQLRDDLALKRPSAADARSAE